MTYDTQSDRQPKSPQFKYNVGRRHAIRKICFSVLCASAKWATEFGQMWHKTVLSTRQKND